MKKSVMSFALFQIVIFKLICFGQTEVRDAETMLMALPDSNFRSITFLDKSNVKIFNSEELGIDSLYRYLREREKSPLAAHDPIRETSYPGLEYERVLFAESVKMKIKFAEQNADPHKSNRKNLIITLKNGEKRRVQTGSSYLWVYDFGDVPLKWLQSLQKLENKSPELPEIYSLQADTKKGRQEYFLSSDGVSLIFMSEDLSTLSSMLEGYNSGNNVLNSPKYYFIKDMVSSYHHYWHIADLRPQTRLNTLLFQLNSQQDHLELVLEAKATMIAIIKYLKLNDNVEKGLGTLFVSKEIAEDKLALWKQTTRNYKITGDGIQVVPYKNKLGPVEGSVFSYVEITKEKFFNFPDEKKE